MPELPDTTDAKSWHRYFAIECNNRGWTLSVKKRTPAEDAEMLNLAHAAAYHWEAVGTELNAMRAKALLAEVHAAIGNGPIAMTLAESIKAYFLDRDDTPDWEVALVHAIVAHAAAADQNRHLHRTAYESALAALNAISDNQDRAIVQETFDMVPKP